MKLFFVLTLTQVAVGVWFLLAMPNAQMLMFMGRNGLATACFVAALLLVVAALVAALRGRVYTTAGLVAGLVYLMAFMRDFVRSDYLQEHFSPAMLTVIPEYSPLVFFLANLAVGLALVVWMLRAAFTRCVE